MFDPSSSLSYGILSYAGSSCTVWDTSTNAHGLNNRKWLFQDTVYQYLALSPE